MLGGVAIVAVEEIPYAHAYTYDILPDSDSASYFAAGALIGSTLRPSATLVLQSVAARRARSGASRQRISEEALHR
ncbi:MAG TPA: hypothetical protein VF316_11780, partial [Polyangiaceae bacterium]